MCGAFLKDRHPVKASIFQAERKPRVLPYFLKIKNETRQEE